MAFDYLNYAKLEYLESSGATTGVGILGVGILESAYLTVDCKFDNPNPVDHYLFGSRQNSDSMMYNGLYSNNVLEYNYQTISYSSSPTVELHQTLSDNTLISVINGVTYTSTFSTENTPSGQDFYLFGCIKNDGSTRLYTSTLRLYYFNIRNTKDQSLQRKLIPAMRYMDGQLGLYDEVNSVFYGAPGNGYSGGPAEVINILTSEKGISIPSIVGGSVPSVGDTFKAGSIPSTDTSHAGEDISWKVIDVYTDQKLALAVSEKALSMISPSYSGLSYSWANNGIHEYLNNAFIFEYGLENIPMAYKTHTTVEYNGCGPGYSDSSLPGTTTVVSEEKLFLLSTEEVESYFTDDNSRITYDLSGTAVSWWLRSTGYYAYENAAYVSEAGAVVRAGSNTKTTKLGFRPAFWYDYDRSYSLTSTPNALGYTSPSSSSGTINVPSNNGAQSWTGTSNTFTGTGTCAGFDDEGFVNGGAAITVTGLSAAFPAGMGIAKAVVADIAYNAVWNDIVDCIEVPDDTELEYGRAYCFDGEKFYFSTKYLDDGYIGIHSDTAGMFMGNKQVNKQLRVASAGFVLAYVDKTYPPGTPLTVAENGTLTKLKEEDIEKNPHKLVGTFWKDEPLLWWGFDLAWSDNLLVEVKGRKWIKVK